MTTAGLLAKSLGARLNDGKTLAHCPVCQPEARPDQRSLSITDNNGRLLVHCFKSGCDFREICDSAGVVLSGKEFDNTRLHSSCRDRYQASNTNRSLIRRLFAQSMPIGGTPAEVHLRRDRGVTCSLHDLPLRYLPSTYHSPSQRYVGAMIAPVEPTGGLHRTFLEPDGTRLKQNAKRMLGPCAGGAVKLTSTSEKLVVCEGIETALSMLSGLIRGKPSVWAALSTSGLKALELPIVAHRLVIAADGDDAGRDAAKVLSARARKLGWDVSILPAPNGCDWNDVLRRRRQ